MEEVNYPKSWPDGPAEKSWVEGKEYEDKWGSDKGAAETQESNWENQNFDPAIYITLARIYDLLAVIALKVDRNVAEGILDMHEAGYLQGQPPSLALDDEVIARTADDEVIDNKDLPANS